MPKAADSLYGAYKETALWKTVDEAVSDLVANEDIVEYDPTGLHRRLHLQET